MNSMSIDISQLPIPNWGLKCPGCGYSLTGLPQHRCPECGARLVMERIVQNWHRLRDPRFTGNELPVPDFGLPCRNCGADLGGSPQHACRQCGQEFDPQSFRPATDWFSVTTVMDGTVKSLKLSPVQHSAAAEGPTTPGAVSAGLTVDLIHLPLIEPLLEHDNIPFFAHDAKTMYDIVFGGRPAANAKVVVASEFYFDFLWLVRKAAREMAEARLAGEGRTWRCPQCGEEVPGHFDLCWNCQALHPDVA